MSRNFRLLIRNLRLIKEQEEQLVETLMIMNVDSGLDLERATAFIQRELQKLKVVGFIPPYSGRQMQLVINNANTLVNQHFNQCD